MASSEDAGAAEVFVKYGPCSRRRLAPVARLQDKVVRVSLCIRVDVRIELSYGSVQLDMLKLRGSLARATHHVIGSTLGVGAMGHPP